DLRRRQTDLWTGDDKVQPLREGQRCNLLSSTTAEGPPRGVEKEIHIASQPGSQPVQLSGRESQVPEAVEADQRRGGVARASAQSSLQRDPFDQLDPHAALAAGLFAKQTRCAEHEIVLAGKTVLLLRRER